MIPTELEERVLFRSSDELVVMGRFRSLWTPRLWMGARSLSYNETLQLACQLYGVKKDSSVGCKSSLIQICFFMSHPDQI